MAQVHYHFNPPDSLHTAELLRYYGLRSGVWQRQESERRWLARSNEHSGCALLPLRSKLPLWLCAIRWEAIYRAGSTSPRQCWSWWGRWRPWFPCWWRFGVVRRPYNRPRSDSIQATRTLALLGQWYVQHGFVQKARQLRTETRALAGGQPCERWLWVIDLGQQLDPHATLQLEEVMLTTGLLPMPRVEAVLDDIEHSKGRPVADRMAFKVAQYSDYPAVLERAIRHASKKGDVEVSMQLEQRLRAVTCDRTGSSF
jgi:hypothetical protein